MPTSMPPCDAKVLLLLPEEWVSELDTVARVNCCTRLALIRRILREGLDDRLSDLNLFWIARRENKKLLADIENYCDEFGFGLPQHRNNEEDY